MAKTRSRHRRSTRRQGILSLLVGASFLSGTVASAATYYWDTNGNTGGAGATPNGTWGTNAYWSTNLDGLTTPGVTNTNARDDVYFSAGTDASGSYTVNINGTQSTRLMTIQEGALTLAGGTLNFNYSSGGIVLAATAGNAAIESNITLGGAQTFTVGADRTLSLSTGTFTRKAGGTMNIRLGTGSSLTSTQAGLDANTAGIIGAWATIGSGTGTNYATFTGSSIGALTATDAATAADLNSVVMGNYRLLAATGATPAAVAANTIRYTGGTGTTTLGATGFSVNGLLHAGSGEWTLTGNTLTIGDDQDLVVNTASNAITISSNIVDNANGSSTLTKTGANTLRLGGNNTYTGITYISQGILNVTHANGLGTTDGHTVINGTGNTSTGGTLSLSGGVTINENITLEGLQDGSRTDPENSGTANYSAMITTSGGTNTINGVVTLVGSFSYRLGVGGGGSILNYGLVQRTGTDSSTLVLSPSSGGTMVFTQAIRNNNGAVIAHAGGTVVFAATGNQIGDLAIQNNTTVRLTANDALNTLRYVQLGQSALINTATGSGNDVGTLFLEGVNQTITYLVGYANAGTAPNNTTTTDRRKVTSSSANNSLLTIGNNNGGAGFDGVIEDGNGGGKTAITKIGTGTQTFLGTVANTYTGDTTVNGGFLVLAKTAGVNAISGDIIIGDGTGNDVVRLTNSNQIADASTISFNGVGANAGILRLNGQNETVGGLISSGGAGIAENEYGVAGLSTLTVNAATGASHAYSGVLRNGDGTGIDGTLKIVKTGSGTQALSGASTYTGGTDVNGGTLLLNNGTTGSATGSGQVLVSSVGALGGAGRTALDADSRVTVQGTLTPGSAAGVIGTLEVNVANATGAATSGISFESASLIFQLGAAGAGISSVGTSDLFMATGTLNEATDLLFTGTSTFNFGGTGSVGWYRLFDTSATSALSWSGLTVDSGTGQITGGLGISGLGSGLSGTLYLGNGTLGDYGDVYMQVVPEPGRALLLMAGLGALLARRCRAV